MLNNSVMAANGIIDTIYIHVKCATHSRPNKRRRLFRNQTTTTIYVLDLTPRRNPCEVNLVVNWQEEFRRKMKKWGAKKFAKTSTLDIDTMSVHFVALGGRIEMKTNFRLLRQLEPAS